MEDYQNTAIKNNLKNGFPIQKNPQLDKKKTMDSFDNFLKLFITQLKHQTPDDVADTKDLLSQLAQFSSVEQQAKSNKLLQQLADNQDHSKLDKVASLIGKNIEYDRSVGFLPDKGNLEFNFEIPKTNQKIVKHSINIFDSDNVIVYSKDKGSIEPGNHKFTWDGLDKNNKRNHIGEYKIRIIATNQKAEQIEVRNIASSKAKRLILEAGQTLIELTDNKKLDITKILGVSDSDNNLNLHRQESKYDKNKPYIDPNTSFGKTVTADFSKINVAEDGKVEFYYNLVDKAQNVIFDVYNPEGLNIGQFFGSSDKGINKIDRIVNLNNGQKLPESTYYLNNENLIQGSYNIFMRALDDHNREIEVQGTQGKPAKSIILNKVSGIVTGFRLSQSGEIFYSTPYSEVKEIPHSKITAINLANDQEMRNAYEQDLQNSKLNIDSDQSIQQQNIEEDAKKFNLAKANSNINSFTQIEIDDENTGSIANVNA